MRSTAFKAGKNACPTDLRPRSARGVRMDISKLPRMSKTTTPSNDAGENVPAPPEAGFPALPPGEAPVNAAAPSPSVTAPTVWCLKCHAPNAPGSAFCNHCGATLPGSGAGATVSAATSPASVQPGIGAEVWVSAIVAIVLMLFGRTFATWAITTMSGGTFHTNVKWTAGPNTGNEVAYWDLEGFTALQDAAIFLFGFAMLLEAIVLVVIHSRIRAKRPLLALALLITLVATL